MRQFKHVTTRITPIIAKEAAPMPAFAPVERLVSVEWHQKKRLVFELNTYL
jgi:hypothetical protein